MGHRSARESAEEIAGEARPEKAEKSMSQLVLPSFEEPHGQQQSLATHKCEANGATNVTHLSRTAKIVLAVLLSLGLILLVVLVVVLVPTNKGGPPSSLQPPPQQQQDLPGGAPSRRPTIAAGNTLSAGPTPQQQQRQHHPSLQPTKEGTTTTTTSGQPNKQQAPPPSESPPASTITTPTPTTPTTNRPIAWPHEPPPVTATPSAVSRGSDSTTNTSSAAPSEEETPSTSNEPKRRRRPHIIMIVIDDMGFADPGFKGSGISTPTIDQLVKSGTLLTNYYVLPACTHTRIALMTGKYPYRSGMYRLVYGESQTGMNPYDSTLANVFRDRGYQAHAVGKWHLGHAWYDYLPTFRGFQSFLGCWLNQDHFNHSFKGAYDLRWDSREGCGSNCSQTPDARGKYSTYVYTDRAIDLIQSIDPSQDDPLFLYLAYQALHTPLQVPSKYRAPYKGRSDWNDARKTYAGMLTAIDDGISAIVDALQRQGLWNNTLMILTTDNGAPGSGQGGSNAPLRGLKMDVFEGAIRADGMIVGPARKSLGIRSGKNNHLFHAVDWLPTLAELSEGRSDNAGTATAAANWSTLDGISQVRSLRGGKSNRREAFLGYEYHDTSNRALAYRWGDLKLIRESSGQYLLYNVTGDVRERKDLWYKARYKSAVLRMRRRIQAYERTFNATAPSLGRCARRATFGTTPWDQPLMIPWCNPELD